MKTQIFKTRIITAIFAILIIAVAAPQAGAQRREQNNSKEKIDNAIKQVEKSTAKERDSHKDYNKPVRPGNDQNKKERPSSNNNHENDRADNNWKNNNDYHKENIHHNNEWNHNHENWNHNRNSDFHVNLDLRPHHDYNWHRFNHISFRNLPRRAVWVLIDGENYAFYRGRFYLPGPFGFYRVTPPDYLRTLPEGCFRVLVDDQPMWNLNGILFLETPFGFKIIV